MAENTKKETFSKAEVQKMIAEAVAKALASAREGSVIQVRPEQYVTVTYVGPMAPKTAFYLEGMGKINRSGGTLQIPKEKFLQGIDYRMEKMLEKRKLIVLSGLTEEETDRYGVRYRKGEYLTDQVYRSLPRLPAQELISIFRDLCDWHRRAFANAIESDYFERGRTDIDVKTLRELNRISRTTDSGGLFRHILGAIGQKLSEEDG